MELIRQLAMIPLKISFWSCLLATAVQAQSLSCPQSFRNKTSTTSERITLEFPDSQNDPYRLRGIDSKGLTAEEKLWVTKTATQALKEAKNLGLINEKTQMNLLFFKSEDGSGTFGPNTDSRHTIYLSEATLRKRDSTILVHELGHVLTNLAGDSHLNSMFGIGEGLADLSVFFLSKQTQIGSDDSRAVFQRSLIDRKDHDFDGSRSAKSIVLENGENHLTPTEYLGGELFSRIIMDIAKNHDGRIRFDFKQLVEAIGAFINHRGASLYQSEIARQLTNELFQFYAKDGPVNFTSVRALADCYWALAISFGKELENTTIQEVLKTRGINLSILKKLSKVVAETQTPFSRKEYAEALDKIGNLKFNHYKTSEISSEKDAAAVIKAVQNSLGSSANVRIVLDWSDSQIGIRHRQGENRIIIPRGFATLQNMTKDAFILTLFRYVHLTASRSSSAQSDYWAALKFKDFLASVGESFLNKDGLPERNIRAAYFLLSFEQYFNPTQSAFDPYAQLPKEIKTSHVTLQERWDAALHGAFQKR